MFASLVRLGRRDIIIGKGDELVARAFGFATAASSDHEGFTPAELGRCRAAVLAALSATKPGGVHAGWW